MAKEGTIYKRSTVSNPLRQGEILSNLVQACLEISSIRSRTGLIVTPKVHPFAIVLSQDCDLDLDFKARNNQLKPDKVIPNVLFCEVIEASLLRQTTDSRTWDRIKINKDERYQFLEKIPAEQDRLRLGLEELGIDFKRYFTIPTDEVYFRLKREAKRRCRLTSPYVEHLSSRFSYYLSRIGLPADHFSEPIR